MPAFKTQVSHTLGREQATDRLKGFLDQVRQRYQDQVSNLQESWQDNKLDFSLTTYGFDIQGTVAVDDDAVHLSGILPAAAFLFKRKIEQVIQGELQKVLAEGALG